MANHTYSKGLLYKKTLNSSGEVTGSVPLLLKTLGSLVIMSDGTDAETAISTAISNMVTPDETTIVTGPDGITISVKKSTSAEIDEILGDVPTSHTWEGYYTKSETEALIDVVDDKISQSGIETALGYTPIPTTAKGSNNGVAELDATGKVPASQLPSYVDDVIESATYAALPETGESGKIYVTLNDDKTYRWSGSAYVEISASLALGETSSTAYRGDRGKTAYDHSQAAHARTDATNAAIVSGKLNINGTATNIGDFKAVSTAASQGLTDTEKANALANIGAVPNSDLAELQSDVTGLNSSLVGVVDNGAKNLLHFNEANTIGENNGSFTINGLNSITVYGKSGWAKSTTSVPLSPDTYTLVFTIESTDVNMAINIHNNSADTNYYSESFTTTGTFTREFTIPTGVSPNVITCRICCNNSATAQTNVVTSKVSNVMICTKAQFNTSPTYEPYALGNQVLTPALIEQVDSGAKNLLNPTTYRTNVVSTFAQFGITATINNDGSIKLNGTATYSSGQGDVYLQGQWASTDDFGYSNKHTVIFSTGSTKVLAKLFYNTSSAGTQISAGITESNKSTISAVVLSIPLNTVFNNETIYPMICTLADWNVSHKYVPYRPNWDLVCQNIKDVNTVLEAVL